MSNTSDLENWERLVLVNYFCISNIHGHCRNGRSNIQVLLPATLLSFLETAKRSTTACVCVCARAHVRTCMHAQQCLTLQPRGLQPTRFLCPCSFPGKNTGVGFHFLLHRIFLEIKPTSLASPVLTVGFFTTVPPGKHIYIYICMYVYIYYIYIYIKYITYMGIYINSQDFSGDSDGKNSACNACDPSQIPGLGRSPGEGNAYPLYYFCLENSMDRAACWATVHGVSKSWTCLSS